MAQNFETRCWFLARLGAYYWLIRRASNNMTNLRHHAPQHGDRIMTIDYCEVTSPYV